MDIETLYVASGSQVKAGHKASAWLCTVHPGAVKAYTCMFFMVHVFGNCCGTLYIHVHVRVITWTWYFFLGSEQVPQLCVDHGCAIGVNHILR